MSTLYDMVQILDGSPNLIHHYTMKVLCRVGWASVEVAFSQKHPGFCIRFGTAFAGD